MPPELGSTTPACATGEAAVDPGTGAEAFHEIGAGDPLTMVHGPQGGWHVDVAGSVHELGADVTVHATVNVPDLDDVQIAGDQPPTFVALIGHTEETCEGTFYAVRFYLDTDQDLVCSLEGKTLRYEIKVLDFATERTATATTEVIAALDPLDVELCAAR